MKRHSFRRGKSSDARHVALMPQLEVRDSFNVQVFPEGMHVFHLPFSDDIRCPEKETSVVGLNVSLFMIQFSSKLFY